MSIGSQGSAHPPGTRKTVLHVGCGNEPLDRVADLFPAGEWNEFRLDIDPNVKADIVASITDMAPVPDRSVDAIWSSHNLEHLDHHQVPAALRECLRVLKPGGPFLAAVPDLAVVAEAILADRIDQPLYLSSLGPIMPLDMLYGHGPSIAEGNAHMAHRTGFTARSLGQVLYEAGFDPVKVLRRPNHELLAVAFRPPAAMEWLSVFGPWPEPAS
ncbi:class I SAM-dependent methyltransferase [Azospirillum formosense]|uniref:class I SAM-dependent methyltransferase n=1 Tax=Azospirillum formosense TaxID=861533 RepID=UPI00339034C3